MIESLPECPVADLIVILRAKDEGTGWLIGHQGSPRFVACQGTLPLVDKALREAASNFLHAPAVVGVVALLLSCQQDTDGVMEVVGPDGVEPVSAGASGPDETHVVALILGNEHHVTRRRARPYAVAELFEEVDRAVVYDSVRGVQTQPVQVIFVYPVTGIVDGNLAHPGAMGAVVIDGVAPRSLVAMGEVLRAKPPPIGAIRTKVVVNDVEDDPEAEAMGLVDEAAEIIRLAIGPRRRPPIDPVVAPVPTTGEVGNRHQLDCGDTESREFR